jgi:RNA polymerase sigma-70 factor (ECF subfamily)
VAGTPEVRETLDDDAVTRAAAGDIDAFTGLVERHRAVALRVAYGIAGDDAEDVVQEACVKAFRALPRFQPGLRGPNAEAGLRGPNAEAGLRGPNAEAGLRGPNAEAGAAFRPWLLAIVANEARNRRRGAGRRQRLSLRLAGRRTTGEPGPAEVTERDDDRGRLLAAVARLPAADREIVALRWFAELTEAETAAALGCPVGTVKSRSSRALARLRTLLGTEGEA